MKKSTTAQKNPSATTVKPRVYICSPFRPISTNPILAANELIDNLKLAKEACTFATLRGCDPVAPHLFYPQFLDDNDPTERALGMELFAYAFDDDDVQCVDLACGEQLPQEVVDAIRDKSIIKAAWNAQFERICLSKYFDTQLSPDDWQCSMVWAASLSLPLKLKNAAEVLKTGEQKDDVGERLIRYFSLLHTYIFLLYINPIEKSRRCIPCFSN